MFGCLGIDSNNGDGDDGSCTSEINLYFYR